jgi:hypothetical protein
MITLPSSPDETFGNDYTLRPAVGEGLRWQLPDGERRGRPAPDLNAFFIFKRQECARWMDSN